VVTTPLPPLDDAGDSEPAAEPPSPTALSAVNFDGVYANGVPIGIAMMTSRMLESGNNYTARARTGTASGAYQVITTTWNGYGGYPAAYLAPPAVQDQFAYEKFMAILKQFGNDVSKIPVIWYYPKALNNPTLMDQVPRPDMSNTLTVRQYQARWMQRFYDLLGAGSPPFLPQNDPAQPLIRSIAFPVLGPVRFINDWQFPRDGGRRFHEGNDLLGSTGQPLRAAVDGVVTRIRTYQTNISGVFITITDAQGYRYNYFHVNDDVPGGAVGAAPPSLRIHPGLEIGSMVKAGQIIAYMGDTGNAVGTPHLHFEIRMPDGTPINPYPSLLAAEQREQCSTGIGPWSTVFDNRLPIDSVLDPEGKVVTPVFATPTTTTSTTSTTTSTTSTTTTTTTTTLPPAPRPDPRRSWSDRFDHLISRLDPTATVPTTTTTTVPPTTTTTEPATTTTLPQEWTATGPDGASWHITSDGKVTATGIGALITPLQGNCTVIPVGEYGTDAHGLPANLLPGDWLWENPTLLALAESSRKPVEIRPLRGNF
jgi:hypothetical protein